MTVIVTISVIVKSTNSSQLLMHLSFFDGRWLLIANLIFISGVSKSTRCRVLKLFSVLFWNEKYIFSSDSEVHLYCNSLLSAEREAASDEYLSWALLDVCRNGADFLQCSLLASTYSINSMVCCVEEKQHRGHHQRHLTTPPMLTLYQQVSAPSSLTFKFH